jgi:hypothetical protein
MRGHEPSREEAKPKRAKRPPGPVPTLGDLASQTSWVWFHCVARDCHHRAAMRLAGIVTRFGDRMTSTSLCARARCSHCGALGATMRLPSWVNSVTGTAPFPGSESPA